MLSLGDCRCDYELLFIWLAFEFSVCVIIHQSHLSPSFWCEGVVIWARLTNCGAAANPWFETFCCAILSNIILDVCRCADEVRLSSREHPLPHSTFLSLPYPASLTRNSDRQLEAVWTSPSYVYVDDTRHMSSPQSFVRTWKHITSSTHVQKFRWQSSGTGQSKHRRACQGNRFSPVPRTLQTIYRIHAVTYRY